MGKFTLQFQNQELEDLYQAQQKRFISKQFQVFISILMIGKIISIADNIRYSQYLMMSVAILFIICECLMVCLIRKFKIDAKMIIIYVNMLTCGSSIIQLILYYFQDFFKLTDGQLFVQLDIIHQGITLFNCGQSHIDSSVLYILFIICKVFIQIEMFGYNSLSMTFSFYSLFYIIDQYQKSKQRRKEFLKSQRNKSLELLIQEFIDDRVCILEKDEHNVRFIPIMINDKIKKLSLDINEMIRQMKIQKSSEYLQSYLYLSCKNNESLLCKYKKQFYEVTYQRFLLKKCQIFMKIKKIYQDQQHVVNYKELYYKQQNILKKISSQNYQTSLIIKQVQDYLFVLWYQKYYLAYKLKIDVITLVQLRRLINCRQFNIIKLDLAQNQILTDKSLLILLFKCIEKYLTKICIRIEDVDHNITSIEILGESYKEIREEYLTFINKILFKIGVGKLVINKSKSSEYQMKMRLLNFKQKYLKIS